MSAGVCDGETRNLIKYTPSVAFCGGFTVQINESGSMRSPPGKGRPPLPACAKPITRAVSKRSVLMSQVQHNAIERGAINQYTTHADRGLVRDRAVTEH